jgi:hypothetical protein
MAQVAEMLGVVGLIVVQDDQVSDTTALIQQYPGVDGMEAASALTYVYDPQEDGQGDYGIQYRQTELEGTYGQADGYLAFAHCDLVWDPLLGIRIKDTLT